MWGDAMRRRMNDSDRRNRSRVAGAVVAVSLVLAACTSSSDDSNPATTTNTASEPAAAAASAPPIADDVSAEELDLGELAVSTTATGFAASAEDAERCGSSEWRLTGAVEYVQASPVPENCFGGAHAFDTTWYGLSLPAGDYMISLTISRGDARGTTSSSFSITG